MFPTEEDDSSLARRMVRDKTSNDDDTNFHPIPNYNWSDDRSSDGDESSSSSSSNHELSETLRKHREMIREMKQNYRVSAFVLRWDLEHKATNPYYPDYDNVDTRQTMRAPVSSTKSWPPPKPPGSPTKRHHVMLSPVHQKPKPSPFHSEEKEDSTERHLAWRKEGFVRRVVDQYDDEDFSRLLSTQPRPRSGSVEEYADAMERDQSGSSHDRFFDSFEVPKDEEEEIMFPDEFFDCVSDPQSAEPTIEDIVVVSDVHSPTIIETVGEEHDGDRQSQIILQSLTNESRLETQPPEENIEHLHIVRENEDERIDIDASFPDEQSAQQELVEDRLLDSAPSPSDKTEANEWKSFIDTCLEIQGNSPAMSPSENRKEEESGVSVIDPSHTPSAQYSEDEHFGTKAISPSSNESSDDCRAFVDIDSDHQYLQYLEEQRNLNEKNYPLHEIDAEHVPDQNEDELNPSVGMSNSTRLPTEEFLTDEAMQLGSSFDRSTVIDDIRRSYISPRKLEQGRTEIGGEQSSPETLKARESLVGPERELSARENASPQNFISEIEEEHEVLGSGRPLMGEPLHPSTVVDEGIMADDAQSRFISPTKLNLESSEAAELNPALLAEEDRQKIDDILDAFLEDTDCIESDKIQPPQIGIHVSEEKSRIQSDQPEEHRYEDSETKQSENRKECISEPIQEFDGVPEDVSSSEMLRIPKAMLTKVIMSLSPLKNDNEEIDAMVADFLQVAGSIGDGDQLFKKDGRPPSMSAEITKRMEASIDTIGSPESAQMIGMGIYSSEDVVTENTRTAQESDNSGSSSPSSHLRVDTNVADTAGSLETFRSPKRQSDVLSSTTQSSFSSPIFAVADNLQASTLGQNPIHYPLQRLGDSQSDFGSPNRSIPEKDALETSDVLLIDSKSMDDSNQSEESSPRGGLITSKTKTKNIFVLPSFTPLKESGSRITSPDLNQYLSEAEGIYPMVTKTDPTRPDDPVATALSRDEEETELEGKDTIASPNGAIDSIVPFPEEQHDSTSKDDQAAIEPVATVLSRDDEEDETEGKDARSKSIDPVVPYPEVKDNSPSKDLQAAIELLATALSRDGKENELEAKGALSKSMDTIDNVVPQLEVQHDSPSKDDQVAIEPNGQELASTIPEFDQHSVSDFSGSPVPSMSGEVHDSDSSVVAPTQDLCILFSYSGDSDEHPRQIRTKQVDMSISISAPPLAQKKNPFVGSSTKPPRDPPKTPSAKIPFSRTQERLGKASPTPTRPRTRTRTRTPGTPHMVETSRSPFFQQGRSTTTAESVVSYFTSPSRYSGSMESPLRINTSHRNKSNNGNPDDVLSPLRGGASSVGSQSQTTTNSVIGYSSPKRSTSSPLRGFHSLASTPRSPAASLFSRMPEGAARSAIRKLHLNHSIHSVDDILRDCMIRACTNKFAYNLHPKSGPCNRCWALAGPHEREQFLERGSHLRIAKTRSGCDRTCTIFPPDSLGNGGDVDKVVPVRLCRPCFFATHQQENGCRLQVYRGNKIKVRPSSYY